MDNAQQTQAGTSHEPLQIFSYTENDAGRIYGGMENDVAFLNVPSIIDLKRNYELESKKCCTLELHMITLIEYHKQNRIPRGIRSQLKPNTISEDIDFRNRYEQICNKFGLDLLLLHIERLQKEVRLVKDKVTTYEQNLKTHLSAEDFTAFISKQVDFLSRHRAELEETKRRKWIRDIRDYQYGHVYNWIQKSGNPARMWDNKKDDDFTNVMSADKSTPFLGKHRKTRDPKNLQGGEAGDGTAKPKEQQQQQQQKRSTPMATRRNQTNASW